MKRTVLGFMLLLVTSVGIGQDNAPKPADARQMTQTVSLSPEGIKSADAIIEKLKALQLEANGVAEKERAAAGLSADWQLDLLNHQMFRKVPIGATQPTSDHVQPEKKKNK